MSHLDRLRHDPAFAGFFADVHWIFWPVLLWQLTRAVRWMEAWGCWDAMVRVRWWGGVEIVYLGDRDPAPGTYVPLAPVRPHWSDPVWASDVPAAIEAAAPPLSRPVSPGAGAAPQRAATRAIFCDTS